MKKYNSESLIGIVIFYTTGDPLITGNSLYLAKQNYVEYYTDVTLVSMNLN